MSRLNYILPRHRTQSRTLILARTQYVYWVGDSCRQDLGDLDPNYFQTLKAGGRERERERLALGYESLVISKNIMNGC